MQKINQWAISVCVCGRERKSQFDLMRQESVMKLLFGIVYLHSLTIKDLPLQEEQGKVSRERTKK